MKKENDRGRIHPFFTWFFGKQVLAEMRAGKAPGPVFGPEFKGTKELCKETTFDLALYV